MLNSSSFPLFICILLLFCKELQQTSNSEFAGGFCTPKDNCPPTAPNCAPKKRTSQDLFEGDSLDMEEDKPDEKRPKVEEGSNQLPSEGQLVHFWFVC